MSPALIVHIAAASVALLAGAAALVFRKGAARHRGAGKVFGVSMLIMAVLGAYIAAIVPARISIVAGLVTLYLVATGWAAVRRPARRTGRFELAAMLTAVGVAILGIVYGQQAASTPRGLLDGFPAGPHYAFAAIAALAAGLDLVVILGGGVAGASRVARHLWRMSLALAIATSALFLGQQQVFPAALRASPVLIAPVFAVLGLMVFWLVRVRLGRRFKAAARPPASAMPERPALRDAA